MNGDQQRGSAQGVLHLISVISGIVAAIVAVVAAGLASYAYMENTYAKKDNAKLKETIENISNNYKAILSTKLNEAESFLKKSERDLAEQVRKLESTRNSAEAALVATLGFSREAERSVKKLNAEWSAATLENKWVKHDEARNIPEYYKDVGGVVHLRGLVKNGANGSTIFTLPEGYKPSKEHLFIVATYNQRSGRVDVMTDGKVLARDVSPDWVSLDGISFIPAQ